MQIYGEDNLLLDLPPELRDMFYEYCITAAGPRHNDGHLDRREVAHAESTLREPSNPRGSLAHLLQDQRLQICEMPRQVHHSLAIQSSPTPTSQTHQRDLLDF